MPPVRAFIGDRRNVTDTTNNAEATKLMDDPANALTIDLECQIERRTAALNAANMQLTRAIAEREAAQDALVRSQKLEAMGRLVAGVSHDFNNILAAILSGLRLLERKVSDPVGKQIVEMSASAANRGAGLVRQLLAFSRQQPLTPVEVDVVGLLDEVKPLIAVSLPSGIILKIDYLDNCGSVLADPSQLQAALLNLAINAGDAMPDGGTLTLRAHCDPVQLNNTDSENHQFVTITVTDTGTGMTPEVLARVAEPFFTTKEVGKGTGLGVATVHGFVTQSGGQMKIESQVGVGTTVTLLLPRADRIARPPANDIPQFKTRESLRILVVDDDRDLRGLTSATLGDLGHAVFAAEDADVALALLDSTPMDLVITDLAMPKTDGMELARRTRAKDDRIPILFMTGNADRSVLAGEIVLEKPFDVSDLRTGVDAAMKTVGLPRRPVGEVFAFD